MAEQPNPEGLPEKQTAEPFEVPDEIDEQTWGELFAEKAAPTEPAAQQKPEEDSSEASPEEEPEEESSTDVAEDHTNQAMMDMIPKVAAEVASRVAQGQRPAAARRNVRDEIVDHLASKAGEGADRASIAEMVDTIMNVANASVSPQTEALKQRLERVESALQRTASTGLLRDYDSLINSLCEKAQITDPFTKNAMSSLVRERGLQQHKQKFDLAHVEQVFRKVNSERLKHLNAQTRTQVVAHKQREAAEPPKKAATGASHATESIRNVLKRPGMNDPQFHKILRGFADRMDKALG